MQNSFIVDVGLGPKCHSVRKMFLQWSFCTKKNCKALRTNHHISWRGLIEQLESTVIKERGKEPSSLKFGIWKWRHIRSVERLASQPEMIRLQAFLYMTQGPFHDFTEGKNVFEHDATKTFSLLFLTNQKEIQIYRGNYLWDYSQVWIHSWHKWKPFKNDEKYFLFNFEISFLFLE